MSNGFSINVEQAEDNMTQATLINDERASATLYAVICTNDEGQSSHGGFIVSGFAQALDLARESNEGSPEGHACRYIPVALGLSYGTFMAVMGGIAATGDDPTEEL